MTAGATFPRAPWSGPTHAFTEKAARQIQPMSPFGGAALAPTRQLVCLASGIGDVVVDDGHFQPELPTCLD